jgi:hypothetical protein
MPREKYSMEKIPFIFFYIFNILSIKLSPSHLTKILNDIIIKHVKKKYREKRCVVCFYSSSFYDFVNYIYCGLVLSTGQVIVNKDFVFCIIEKDDKSNSYLQLPQMEPFKDLQLTKEMTEASLL